MAGSPQESVWRAPHLKFRGLSTVSGTRPRPGTLPAGPGLRMTRRSARRERKPPPPKDKLFAAGAAGLPAEGDHPRRSRPFPTQQEGGSNAASAFAPGRPSRTEFRLPQPPQPQPHPPPLRVIRRYMLRPIYTSAANTHSATMTVSIRHLLARRGVTPHGRGNTFRGSAAVAGDAAPRSPPPQNRIGHATGQIRPRPASSRRQRPTAPWCGAPAGHGATARPPDAAGASAGLPFRRDRKAAATEQVKEGLR